MMMTTTDMPTGDTAHCAPSLRAPEVLHSCIHAVTQSRSHLRAGATVLTTPSPPQVSCWPPFPIEACLRRRPC